LVIFSCKKERPQLPVPSPVVVQSNSGTKVFVLNQGVWPNDNSSVTLYDEDAGLIADNYFKLKNPNIPLGSVPQSMTKIGDKYFVVVNSANKLIVLDSSFVKISEITGLNSPRYIEHVRNNKAYVSDLYAENIHIINTQTLSKSGTIKCKGWTEQMTTIANKTYVCNYDSAKIYVVDNVNDVVSDSIQLRKGAEWMVQDKNKNIWVLFTSIYNTEMKYLTCIDPTTKSVIKDFEFATSEFPTALHINTTGDKLYYINTHVFSMNISDTQLPSQLLINGTGKTFYALGVSPVTERLYVSDSKYGQAIDNIYIYKKTGEQLSSFQSGYITGNFFFEKK
jgi:hypothetical protein